MVVDHLQLQMMTITTMRMLCGRDSKFSFECFALGIDGNEPLFQGSGVGCGVNVEDVDVNVHHHGQRPRVHSIIFDPTSFLVGGIHEMLALLLLRYESVSLLESPGGGKDIVDDGQLLLAYHVTTGEYDAPNNDNCGGGKESWPITASPSSSLPIVMTPQALSLQGTMPCVCLRQCNGAAVEVASATTGQQILLSPQGGGDDNDDVTPLSSPQGRGRVQ
jgi:hypothetical protein